MNQALLDRLAIAAVARIDTVNRTIHPGGDIERRARAQKIVIETLEACLADERQRSTKDRR